MLLVEQNVDSALAVGRPRLRDERAASSCTRAARATLRAERARQRDAAARGLAMMAPPLLRVDAPGQALHAAAAFERKVTFSLEADFAIEAPAIVGVMGPNGSGKTTLFELITGSNQPTSGRVLRARAGHPPRALRRARPARDPLPPVVPGARVPAHAAVVHARARRTAHTPLVHLFDEPQFNTQDGYIGFMLDFFRRLRAEGRLVFLCLHPNERYHLDILREICERFVFVDRGRLLHAPDFAGLVQQPSVKAYLGRLAPAG